jgi:hypothetical protein
MRFRQLYSLALGLAAATMSAASAEADPCHPLGQPSYTADRQITVGGHIFAAKVFVSGPMVREETNVDGRTAVRVADAAGSGFAIDPQTNQARRIPAPAVPPVDKATNRITREDGAGGTVVFKIEFQRNSVWSEIGRTVCRRDGVMLMQDMPLPNEQGRPDRVVTRQSNIRLGPVDPALFQPPPGLQ